MNHTKTQNLRSELATTALSNSSAKLSLGQVLAGDEYASLSSMYQDFLIELPPVALMALLTEYGLKADDVKGNYIVDSQTLASLHANLTESVEESHKVNQSLSVSSKQALLTLQSAKLLAAWPQQISWLQFNDYINAFLLAWLNDYKLGVSIDDAFKILNCLAIQKSLTTENSEATSPAAIVSAQYQINAKFQRFMMHLIARVTSQLDQYKFHYIQNFDIETNLPNEQLMQKFIHQRLEENYHQQHQAQDNAHVGLIVVNLNINFDEESQLNTSASVLLKAAVQLIERHLNADATIFRVGTSELGILLTNLHFPAQINLIASRLAHAFESALPIDNITLILKPYFGCVGAFNLDASNKRYSAIGFYEHARLALHHAMIKEYQIEVYDAHITASFSNMHALDEAIINALQQNELTIYLQPIVTLPAEICMNAEILLRWDNNKWQDISPARLIDSIYKKGFGKVFIRWLINTACQAVSALIANHQRSVALTVNLSVTDLLDTDLPELLTQSIALWDMPAENLIIEITESDILVDEVRAASVIDEIVSLGCKLALDDFGTGYSSMARLRNMPIDFVKIDQSFVRNIANSSQDKEIVHSVIKLAHSLGKQVVAEGVEDQACLDILKEMHCEKIQGYYYAKPMNFEDFNAWLGAHHLSKI